MGDSAGRPITLSGFVMRYGILLGSAAAIMLTGYSLQHFQNDTGFSPSVNLIGIGICAVLLGSYTWLAFYQTQLEGQAEQIGLRLGGWLGLVTGLFWVWFDADSPIELLGTPREVFSLRIWTLIIPTLTCILGFYAARRTTMIRAGMWVGVWSGVISALVTFVGLMVIVYSKDLTNDGQVTFLRINSESMVSTSTVQGYVVFSLTFGAINHLWIDPLIGILFGGLGGRIAVPPKLPES